MRLLRGLLCTTAMLVVATTGRAQTPPYQATIDRFFELLESNETDEALAFLYSSNPWISRSPDAVATLRSRLTELPDIVGGLRNRELLQHRTLGTRFAYVSYLAAYERQPVRFVFEFYRPDEDWITFSFAFDDELDDDVEAAAVRDLATAPR